MPRKGQWPPPIYPRNAAPGQRTFCRIFRDGKPHDYPLGPAGLQEQKEAYARLQAELLAGEAQPSSTPAPVSALSVVEALSRFADHAETRYASTAELHHFRAVLRVVRALYASLPLPDFGPKHLGAVRAALVLKGWCRRTINRALTRVKTCWRWLEAEGLTAPGTWHGLCAVGGVQYGHAPDKGDVLPVPEADLLATLPCLSPTVRAAALVQLHCGGRPSEVLGLRPCDIQRTGTVQLPGLTIPLGGIWAAVLSRHKMSHRGRTRVLLFGPAAQEALLPLLDRPPEAYLFSPREAYLWYCQLHGKTPNLAQGQHARRQVPARELLPGHPVRLQARRGDGVDAVSPTEERRHAAGHGLRPGGGPDRAGPPDHRHDEDLFGGRFDQGGRSDAPRWLT